MGNPYNVEQARVSFPKLDSADVCPVKATQFGEVLLGNAVLEALSPHSIAKKLAYAHEGMLSFCRL